MGLSPGLDFETRLFYKADAAKVLEAQLARAGYVCKPITLGANTDPYQPVERRMGVTRSILEVLARTRHPVTVITKHALVLRDLDLLSELAQQGLASVGVSITTQDGELKRTLEPRAASPQARLRVLSSLHFPQRSNHVMALIRDMRGGRDNDPRFGSRMRGTGPYAELLRQRFQIAVKRLDLNRRGREGFSTALFTPPTPPGSQLRLGL
jgi:DNA repair photolyase